MNLVRPTQLQGRAALIAVLFGLATDGVYHAKPVTRFAVGSYSTISPLPVPQEAIGGLLSVALSVRSPCPVISRHPALCCPDFPPTPRRQRPRFRLQLNQDSIKLRQCPALAGLALHGLDFPNGRLHVRNHIKNVEQVGTLEHFFDFKRQSRKHKPFVMTLEGDVLRA